MRNRAPFDLTLPLNIWNALLALFSIVGTVMLFPEFIGTIQNNGFQGFFIMILIIQPLRALKIFTSYRHFTNYKV